MKRTVVYCYLIYVLIMETLFSFPLAFALNTFAIQLLLLAAGFSGHSELAADLGIIQSAALALYYSFSANARNLILRTGQDKTATVTSLLLFRLLLALPLGIAAWVLSAQVAGTAAFLTVCVLTRRGMEWLAEIHLSERELAGDRSFSLRFSVTQAILLAAVCAASIWTLPGSRIFLVVWALSPAAFSLPFLLRGFKARNIDFAWREILPNFGSTSVIGVGSYLFRVLLLITAGRAASGELFTAFSAGGMISSLYERVLGPSLVFAKEQNKRLKLLSGALWATAGGGALLAFAYFKDMLPAVLSFKDGYFWGALGLSVIGGVVMLLAQRIKISLIQNALANDLFAPDLLANVLIITSVPVLNAAFGPAAFVCLFLLSGAINLSLYKGYEFSIAHLYGSRHVLTESRIKIIKHVLAFLLLLPVFFQLSGGLFRSAEVIYEHGGSLKLLPLPISLPAYMLGLCILGAYGVKISKLFIFSLFCALSFSLVITGMDGPVPMTKFVLMMQSLIPVFAFMLGEIYARDNNTFVAPAKAFLAVLCIVVPLTLYSSWNQGLARLLPYLYIFSIYQLYQYISTIFVCAFILTIFALHSNKNFKLPMLLLSPIMGIYAMAACSFTAASLFFSGMITYTAWVMAKNRQNAKTAIACLLLGTLAFGIYCSAVKDRAEFKLKYNFNHLESGIATGLNDNQLLQEGLYKYPSIRGRAEAWKFYSNKIFESPTKNLLFGQTQPPPRELYPSAHNYYLDTAYNFGLISLLPFVGLFAYTLWLVWHERKRILNCGLLTGLTLAVLFFVMVDNNLKVSFRQPYSGIFYFYLWGFLLKLLSNPTATENLNS